MPKNNDTKYVFRLQSQRKGQHDLQNSLKHWDESRMFDDKQIRAIESSNERSFNQPTSIPSPFARVALVKTAFDEVAEHGEQALAAYQKIVSDSLDVAEIFFTLEKWKDKIEIVKWDKATDLPQLEAGHKALYKTLRTFLESDATAYNFDKMKCLYLLKYKPTGDIIGSTSPCTLFFSSANRFNQKNESGAVENPLPIQLSNNHTAYSGIFPLSRRGWAFQKYLYTWLAANNETHIINEKSALLFNEFYNYAQQQKERQPEKIQEINQILENRQDAIQNLKNNYHPIRGYEILGKPIYEQKADESQAITSDFEIKTTLKSEDLPLILPLQGGNGSGYEDWQLTETTRWSNCQADPNADRTVLPDGTKYRWLTINDFLEDKIIYLPHTINQAGFFDGNLTNPEKSGYLLPLKNLYFTYFDTTNDVKAHLTIDGGRATARVILKIPVKKGEIVFEKEYKASEMTLVEQADFDCTIFPNAQFDEEKDAYYRVGLFMPYDEKGKACTARFYKGEKQVPLGENEVIKRNTDDPENPICTTYALNQKSFDRLQVTLGEAKGMLIPELPKRNQTEIFTFAVDFGTTNTHIEYKTSGNHTIKPFDIQENAGEQQVQFLHGKTEQNTLVTDMDLIPQGVGAALEFKFPFRSALAMAKNRNVDKMVFPFLQANIVIPFEKRRVPKYNEIQTQLKWEAAEANMGYFIDSLCFMMRNKVVLNNGILHKTKIVWFYPISMAGTRSKIIADKWKLAYAKYFLGILVDNVDDLPEIHKDMLTENIKDLPESVTPFLCYKDDPRYKDTINNLVSIDIGGGTTDVVFVTDRKVDYVTSFRFAANSIFGLGDQITPVVAGHQSEIEEKIERNDPHFKLRNILKGITDSKSGDLASFFFSLSNNKILTDQGVAIDFNSILKGDKDQKLVFVLFYAAIIYHTAQIMKAKAMPLPRHITFSGNGSRIVNIVGEKNVLEALSKAIFEKIYGEKYGTSGLTIIQNTVNPKEVTCKGGIKAADKEYVQTPFEPVVLWGVDATTFVTDRDTYAAVEIDDCVEKTNKQVIEFVNYAIDDLLTQRYTGGGVVSEPFIQALGINPQTLQAAKEVRQRHDDFINYTKNGIKEKIESVNDTFNTQIEETFFFYPITSFLRAISNSINQGGKK